jgi:hypothetical protein
MRREEEEGERIIQGEEDELKIDKQYEIAERKLHSKEEEDNESE